MRRAVSTLYGVVLQPLLTGNSAELSQADNSRTIQRRAMNLTSLDSLAQSKHFHLLRGKCVSRCKACHVMDSSDLIGSFNNV